MWIYFQPTCNTHKDTLCIIDNRCWNAQTQTESNQIKNSRWWMTSHKFPQNNNCINIARLMCRKNLLSVSLRCNMNYHFSFNAIRRPTEPLHMDSFHLHTFQVFFVVSFFFSLLVWSYLKPNKDWKTDHQNMLKST